MCFSYYDIFNMSFSKMVVIPQEEYLQLSMTRNIQEVKNVDQPVTDQLKQLSQQDREIQKIEDPYRRMQLQAENLEERRHIREKLRKFITLSTPRAYRMRAERLFDFIDPHVKFNERGEIIEENGDVIRNSHIDDLLQYAVRDVRRKLGAPQGWEYFQKVLSNHNVPHNIIGGPTINELNKVLATDSSKGKVVTTVKREPIVSPATSPTPKRRGRRSTRTPKSYSKY